MKNGMTNGAVCRAGFSGLFGIMAAGMLASAASAQTYSSLVTSNPSLVGYYHLDETAGATAAVDSSGNGNNAGLNGTIDFGQAGIPGNGSDTAYGFVGAGDARLPGSTLSENVDGSSIENGFTLEFWMNTTDASQQLGAAQWYSGDGLVDAEVPTVVTDFGTAISGTQVLFGVGAGDVTIASGNAVDVADGNWHLVDADWSTTAYNGLAAGTMQLFIDGVLVSSAAGPTAPRAAAAANGMTFGETQTNINQYFTGDMDEIALYDQPLTASQIVTHYDSGIGIGGNGVAPEPAAVTLILAGFVPLGAGIATRRRAR